MPAQKTVIFFSPHRSCESPHEHPPFCHTEGQIENGRVSMTIYGPSDGIFDCYSQERTHFERGALSML